MEGLMVERRDVDFEVEGGDRLRGWLFQPEGKGRTRPAISMAHGYAGVHGFERFARAFAEAGFVVLLQRAYEQALEPKKLVTIDGGHFEAYLGSPR
jgi:dienelactone hydrolase